MTVTNPESGRWWYLDLVAEFPELEIYTGHGWGPDQELGQLELGDHWLIKPIYITIHIAHQNRFRQSTQPRSFRRNVFARMRNRDEKGFHICLTNKYAG